MFTELTKLFFKCYCQHWKDNIQIVEAKSIGSLESSPVEMKCVASAPDVHVFFLHFVLLFLWENMFDIYVGVQQGPNQCTAAPDY